MSFHGRVNGGPKTAVFTALATALAALPIGLLALGDPDAVTFLETHLFFGRLRIGSITGPAVIAFLCCILFAVQYAFTLAAGTLTYRTPLRNGTRNR